jgi:hypothetical protein
MKARPFLMKIIAAPCIIIPITNIMVPIAGT